MDLILGFTFSGCEVRDQVWGGKIGAWRTPELGRRWLGYGRVLANV